MVLRLLLGAILVVVSCLPAAAKRVALVIGNGAYQNAVPLLNPVNDAKAMSTKLGDLGFEVFAGYDQSYNDMQATIRNFARNSRGAEVALLFYAGHGMQVGGQNYLVPIDAGLTDETALDFETLPVDFILKQMSNDVDVQLVFLDACRDNPLARTLARTMSPTRSASIGVGLAELKLDNSGADGSVIAFATSPGDVALDGDGGNSPFTTALLQHIDAPNTSIQTVMTRVTGDVYRSTDERQRPWVNASLIGEVMLNPVDVSLPEQQVASLTPGTEGSTAAAPAAVVTAPAANSLAWDREKTLFEFAQRGGTVADFEAYLASYPNGHFADIARNFIGRLNAAQTPASTASQSQSQAQQKVAAVAPATPQLGGQSRELIQTDPTAASAANSITNEIRTTPGTEVTEAALNWNRSERKEVQVRIELTGQELGRPDGALGPKSRAAIRAWQTENQMIPTGYFTGPQYQVLVNQTIDTYAAYEAEQKAAAAVRAKQRSTSSNRKTTQKRRNNNNNGAGVAGAAFIGGVVGGLIGGAIR